MNIYNALKLNHSQSFNEMQQPLHRLFLSVSITIFWWSNCEGKINKKWYAQWMLTTFCDTMNAIAFKHSLHSKIFQKMFSFIVCRCSTMIYKFLKADKMHRNAKNWRFRLKNRLIIGVKVYSGWKFVFSSSSACGFTSK